MGGSRANPNKRENKQSTPKKIRQKLRERKKGISRHRLAHREKLLIRRSRSSFELFRELKNHDDGFVDDDRK